MTVPSTTPPRRAPLMSDVAKLAGVSIGTVSNVLNTPTAVRASTRERVLDAISTLGFVPNSTARSLAAGRGTAIGFIAVDLGNSYFLDISRGIEREADTLGRRVLLANSDVDLGKQTAHLELFEQARAAGIVLAPFDGPLDEVRTLRRRGTKIVFVNWPGVDGESCGVVVDEVLGGELSAQHLIDHGRTRLAFVGGPFSLTAVRDRFEGASRAARAAPGVTLELITTTKLTVPPGIAVGREIAARPPSARPDGIVSASDALAAGIVQSLVVEGVRVPDDVAIVGYDDNHFADSTLLPLSTVGQPGVEMGHRAMRLLAEEITAPAEHVHETVTLSPRLIVRASSASA
ncbi:LacI family DNA-binding transcriptional regulator [Clavibacter sp. VKM Ac-2542]|uniref:LacI family DNA-binding transcriptional regulator n=1 Tax=Clavibacter TaxID=1573 RepID=UPI00188C92F9|nr:LacI family DNA-binding transcriptional regulator [Clavibacter sp. VKM Ac-2542]MBF4622414.1 LacI family DNA-binding transcriptional regulator [Clavibacter sp. VKM Ac-2542]